MHKKLLMMLAFFFVSFSVYGQTEHSSSKSGLRGEEIVCAAVNPKDSNSIFVGTDKGVYRKNIKEKTWKSIECFVEKCRVNQILFSVSGNEAYVATEKGLYLFDTATQACQELFDKSDQNERNCVSVGLLKDGALFVGTKGGLFFKMKGGGQWDKKTSPFDNERIICVYGAGDIVYVAVQSGVYRSKDEGKSWEKIFNVYSYTEAYENDNDNFSSDESEAELSPVKHMTGLEQQPSCLYVATRYGVFLTEDSGNSWNRLPLAGLDFPNLRFLFINPLSKDIFAVAKSGVYQFQNKAWVFVITAFDCRQVVFRGQAMVLITARDIFEYFIPLYGDNKNNADTSLDRFNNEPTVQKVQKMAIEYCEVSDEKIKDWRRRAQWRAFLPEVSLDYDKTVTTALGATYDRTQVGPMDWGVNLKWDFADLIYNSDQTTIDTRSKLLVELRNDVLAEVTRLYFERRRLQIELFNGDISSKGEQDKKLKVAELSALIDRLTGGQFSNAIVNRR